MKVNTAFFQKTFEQLATDGCLGTPDGDLAYCYLRVSSSGQAEEGRSGLPRQLLHIHEAALKHHLKVSWDLVFADDHSGFEFEDRPALTRLRREYSSEQRRASTLLIENLDRLSRNADWHQAFLLNEMAQVGLTTVFWQPLLSFGEQAVMAAVAQQGMKQEIDRMAEGTRFKARSGRVTAHTRAYGYRFVDSIGKEGIAAKSDTHYALNEQEAEVIQLIYQKVALEDISTRALATYLEERFPPPGRYKHWEPRQIALFIRNPLYKGQFAAGRFQEVKMPAKKQRPHERLKLVIKRVERPPEEWTIVPVPSIVSAELWERANLALDRNAHLSRRNGQDPFLLTGLLTCDVCGYKFVGGRKKNTNKEGVVRLFRYYRCTARSYRTPAVAAEIGCTQRTINADLLDATVWQCICRTLLEPVGLFAKIDEKLFNEGNLRLRSQIEFLQGCICEKDQEDSKLYKAYVAGVFDAQEYAIRRTQVQESKQKLEQELATLEKQQVTQSQIQELQTLVADLAAQAAITQGKVDLPFATKHRIVRLLLQEVSLNVAQRSLRIEGVVSGSFPLLPALPD